MIELNVVIETEEEYIQRIENEETEDLLKSKRLKGESWQEENQSTKNQ